MVKESQSVLSRELFALIEPVLEEGKSASFYVSGMSMWPFICHKRDSVIIKSPDYDHLKVGDIVLVKIPVMEKYLLHRITHMDSEKIQTAGDSNCYYDGWFPREFVVAIVTDIIYKGKQIPVTDRKYQMLSTIWRKLYVIRPILLRLLLFISKLKKKIS